MVCENFFSFLSDFDGEMEEKGRGKAKSENLGAEAAAKKFSPQLPFFIYLFNPFAIANDILHTF